MSLVNRNTKVRKIATALGCSLLIVITLVTFHEQIPTIQQPQTTKVYDNEFVNALITIKNVIPQNATLVMTKKYPQVTYFTDHKVVAVPKLESVRSLVEFMWKINSSHLLLLDGLSGPIPDNTPLFIKLAEKPFEKVFEYYYDYVSHPKPRSTVLNIEKISKEAIFQKLFEKVFDYDTESSVVYLYRLRNNITNNNLSMVTDDTKPMITVSFAKNGTIVGTATDADSKIKKVEISVNDSSYQLANPRAPDDWSTWSFSHIINSEGTKRILVRATDYADNRIWMPVDLGLK